MKTITFVLFTFFAFLLYGQKTEIKTIENSSIKAIVVEGDAIFKANIKTVKTNLITLTSKIEGEYSKNTSIITEIKNDTLLVTSAYQTYLEKDNDKLSAHKVLSIEVQLELPENLFLYFKSEIASAQVTGKFKRLIIELYQGNAKLLNFMGDAIINTFNGHINIETNYAIINALTKTGKITKEKIIKADNEIVLHSINGDINVTKIKN